jgi:hypothetical protein
MAPSCTLLSHPSVIVRTMILTSEHLTVPAVRYEACADFVTDESWSDTCATCGWLADDHTPVAAGAASRAAA